MEARGRQALGIVLLSFCFSFLIKTFLGFMLRSTIKGEKSSVNPHLKQKGYQYNQFSVKAECRNDQNQVQKKGMVLVVCLLANTTAHVLLIYFE